MPPQTALCNLGLDSVHLRARHSESISCFHTQFRPFTASRRHQTACTACSFSNLQPAAKADKTLDVSRRSCLLATALLSTLGTRQSALAFEPPPQGFQRYRDKIDGYTFLLPESWTPLSSSGNDVFFRNPYNVNENLFVSISSPSSSKYQSVDDLKSPQNAAEITRRQYTRELMSTRLGVKRDTDVLSASEREASDGKKYIDVELVARSYGSRNQLAVSQRSINAGMELEWERHYITVLGVANKRLYEFRLQTSKDTYDEAKDNLKYIAESFRCVELDA